MINFVGRIRYRIVDIFLETKHAFQRMFRGWDDSVVWSIDWHLTEYMPVWLNKLKESKHGTPGCFFPENYNGDNPELEAEANRLWKEQLDIMVDGFVAARNIQERRYDNDTELDVLREKFELGMKSFTEHFFSLWD